MKRLIYLAAAAAIAFTLTVPATSDAQAKIKFKMPKRMDSMFLKGYVIPDQELDILNNSTSFKLANNSGILYMSPLIWGSEMKTDSRLTKFKYKEKRTGEPQVRKLKIKSRRDPDSDKLIYYFKIKLNADLQMANPYDPANAGATVDDLADMYTEFLIGDAPIYRAETWQWVRDKYWYLTGGIMSTWY